MDSELREHSGADPEHRRVVVVPGAHERVEPVHAMRRPRAPDLEDDRPPGGVEPDAKCLRRAVLELGAAGLQQAVVRAARHAAPCKDRDEDERLPHEVTGGFGR